MSNSNNKKESPPHMDWPEEAYGNERELSYEKLLLILGPAEWVVIVPTPAPLGAVRSTIESDCKNVLTPMEMAYDGVAWLCSWSKMAEALPELFHARQLELAFLSFDERPSISEITSALQSIYAKPATLLLIFEDGELVEKREFTS